MRWCRVILGVTTANLSLSVQGNLSMDTLLCQVTTDPGSSSEVSSATVLKVETVLRPLPLCLQQLSCDRFKGICKVKLKHLSPGSQYAVTGRCSVTGRLWGPWTKSESFKTRESSCAILVELCENNRFNDSHEHLLGHLTSVQWFKVQTSVFMCFPQTHW